MVFAVEIGRFDQVNRVPFTIVQASLNRGTAGRHEPIAHIRGYRRALRPPANVEIDPISVETTINKTEEWSPRADPHSSVLCAVLFEVINFGR
jgi:hypothetical protein